MPRCHMPSRRIPRSPILLACLLALVLLPLTASARTGPAEPAAERGAARTALEQPRAAAPLPWEATPPAPTPPPRQTPLPDDGIGSVTAAASSTACDNNSDGDQTWNGCRGTGCSVCTEKVSAYPCYYINHPNCVANSTCYGLYYDCDSSCPAPVAADACPNTSNQVDTCGSCSYPAYGVDGDYDGIPDRLEYNLAHKFFPAILMRDHEDDKGETYFDRGWSIPYTVQPLPPTGVCNEGYECLEIRYGIAYRKDTGDNVGFDAHLGDSEFYAVLVQRTASWSSASGYSGYWQMIRDFTAAHWGSGSWVDSSKMASYGHCGDYCGGWDNNESACISSSDCSWQPGMCYGTASDPWDSCYNYWQEGNCYFAGCSWIDSNCAQGSTVPCWSTYPKTSYVTLYAAEGKHALYHSDYECDNGGLFGADDCPSHDYNLRWDKYGKLQNVGSFQEHANFDTYIQHPNGSKLYYVWGGDSFADSTDYRDHFLHPFDWRLP